MKKLVFLFCFLPTLIFSQEVFDIEAYQTFLNNNQNMESSQLLRLHPTGTYNEQINHFNSSALYLDSIYKKYELTEGEISLLEKNGFVVTERIKDVSLGAILRDIYVKDLPVFVTTDLISHAFHRSYDELLKSVEFHYLIPKLKSLLGMLAAKMPDLHTKYFSNSGMVVPLRDLDFYIATPRKILEPATAPYYSSNITKVNTFVSYVNAQEEKSVPFLSKNKRNIDFSQFKPRGHYTIEWLPDIKNYFKAMVWLGRMEIYLTKPKCLVPPTTEDVNRQVIVANLFAELLEDQEIKEEYKKIENILKLFVGDQDNVTPENMTLLRDECFIADCCCLTDTNRVKEFQSVLAEKPFSGQKILSQILVESPFAPKIVPPSAFLVFGQRYVIDSYVTGKVVFDNIRFNGEQMRRMLPSTLDVLFALGNDAAAQLLTDELEKWKYSTNLSALRYLIDSYDTTFWNKTIYNNWLNSIRTLNSPEDRNDLPDFMKTGAWWQQKMNSQLASWSELRHDHILYAKQSYTGGAVCSFPYSFVEPVPEFYNVMKRMAGVYVSVAESVTEIELPGKAYFNRFAEVMDTLENIAEKELANIPLSEAEKTFLKGMFDRDSQMCGSGYDGWYSDLYYAGADMMFEQNHIVADYHTAPTDEGGAPVGWVKHAGTGKANLIVTVANLPNVGDMAFVGAVPGYYEYTTENFLRLTDEEWKEEYLLKSAHPDWTNLYMADNNGVAKPIGRKLITNVERDETDEIAKDYLIGANYPNPFNPSTTISFTIPASLTNREVKLNIYDIQGRLIKRLVNKELPAGTYMIRWNGKNNSENSVASGIYFYDIRAGNSSYIGKMNLVK